jgi:hypothetical protein
MNHFIFKFLREILFSNSCLLPFYFVFTFAKGAFPVFSVALVLGFALITCRGSLKSFRVKAADYLSLFA